MSACPELYQPDELEARSQDGLVLAPLPTRLGILHDVLRFVDEETGQRILSVHPDAQAYLAYVEAQSAPHHVDFAQQPDQGDLQIIDNAVKSKVGDEIRNTCWRIQQPKDSLDFETRQRLLKEGREDTSRSADVFSLAQHVLFWTGGPSKLCPDQRRDAVIERTGIIVKYLAPGYEKYSRPKWLYDLISEAYDEKLNTEYDEQTSTGGFYIGHWPDGRTRSRIKALPKPLPEEPVSQVNEDMVREDALAAGFKERDIVRVISLLVRLRTGKYVSIGSSLFTGVVHNELKKLWDLGKVQAWKLRDRLLTAGLIEQDERRQTGKGRNLYVRIPKKYLVHVSIGSSLFVEEKEQSQENGLPEELAEAFGSVDKADTPPQPKAPWQASALSGMGRYNRREGRMQTWRDSNSYQDSLRSGLPIDTSTEPPVVAPEPPTIPEQQPSGPVMDFGPVTAEEKRYLRKSVTQRAQEALHSSKQPVPYQTIEVFVPAWARNFDS